MEIPSRKECFELIKKMEMMDHIIDHSVMVSNVSFYLCKTLQKQCPNLDIELVTSAALLHDITKTRSFETNEVHSETGCELLTDMGYPEVGDLIRQHVLLDEYTTNSPITMAEILNYSDKRVLHDQVVSLNRRLDYIRHRYGLSEDLRKKVVSMCDNTLCLEQKIFKLLSITPDKLADAVEKRIKREA